jgi:hypothetical protein
MDFLFHTMRHIPDAGDSGGAKNENYDEKDKQDFDERAARFGWSSRGRLSSGSRCRRPWLRSTLRRARGAGRGGRRWCCGPHRRTGSGRSAPGAESLSIIQRTATIPAKTSHFRLRGSLPCRCGVRFFRSCQNRRARASATCYFVARRSYVLESWACATEECEILWREPIQ